MSGADLTWGDPRLLWLLVPWLAAWLLPIVRRARGAAPAIGPRVQRVDAGATGTLAGILGRARPLLGLAGALAIVAIARPQWGSVERASYERVREIVVALDLSRSMLATDVKPSRIERSRLLVQSLVEKLKGERIGLVVFAGSSFLQCPLSSDYEVLGGMLTELNPDFVPQGGTDFRAMLRVVADAMPGTAEGSRFLVLLSDGEDLGSDWAPEARVLRERGVRAITLGVGTPEGTTLPARDGGFVKNEDGAVVLSRLVPATLEELARETDGVYRDASGWVDLAAEIETMVRASAGRTVSEEQRRVRIERFQWALVPAVVLLLLSLWLEFPVRLRARAMRLVPPGAFPGAVALLALAMASAHAGVAAGTTGGASTNLAKALAEVSALAQPSGSDYARVAGAVLDYGREQLASGTKVEPPVVEDALQAVQAGETRDPQAADWKQLREALNRLLDEPPPQQQDPKDSPQDSQKQQEKSPQQQKSQYRGGKQDEPQSGDSKQQSESDASGKQGEPGKQDEPRKDQGQGGKSPQGENAKRNGESGQDAKPGDSPQSGSQPEGNGADRKEAADSGEQPGSDQSRETGSQSGADREQAARKADERAASQAPSEATLSNLGRTNAAPRAEPSGTQKVGGQAQRGLVPAGTNNAMGSVLLKLDDVRSADSPGRLFQLLDGTNRAPSRATGGKDY
jgi:Ca-activated chloride channel family protein